jgi:hypothetical protein
MSTPLQGTSGPSGSAGLRPAFGQPVVSVNHITWSLALTLLKQVSPEQPILREIKRLIVRLFIDTFGLRTNKLLDGTILPLERHRHSTR